MNRKHMTNILRLVLTAALLVWLFTSIIDEQERQRFLEEIRQLNGQYYLIGLIFYVGFILCWASRWRFILRSTGEDAPLLRLFGITLVSNFFALFLPEAVGADLARMTAGMQRRTNANYVSTVVLDRVVGLMALVLIAGGALLVGSDIIKNETASYLVAGVALAFVVGGWLFFNRRFMETVLGLVFRLPVLPRFEQPIRNLYEALYQFRRRPGVMFIALALALLVQAVEITSVIWLGQALGIEASIPYYFVVLPVVWLITTIPISIGGLGVRESVFIVFFAQAGAAHALALSLLYYSFKVITGLIGGLLYLRPSAGIAPAALVTPTNLPDKP